MAFRVRWTIKTTLIGWALLGVSAILILGGVSYWGSISLSKNNAQISAQIVPMERTSFDIANTITLILDQQSAILSANQRSQLEGIDFSDLQQSLNQSLEQLNVHLEETGLAHQKALNQEVQAAADQYFADLQQLLEGKKQLTHSMATLHKQRELIEKNITLIQQLTESVAGKVSLISKRYNRNLRKLIQQEEVQAQEMDAMSNLINTVDQLLANDSMGTVSAANHIRFNVSQLNNLVHQILLTNNQDLLVSLKSNSLKQLTSDTEQQFSELMDTFKQDGELLGSLTQAHDLFTPTLALIQAEQDSLLSMRLAQLAQQNTLDDLKANLVSEKIELLTKIDQLRQISDQIIEQSEKTTTAVISSTRWSNISVALILVTLTILLSYSVIRRINQSLKALSVSMNYVTQGNLTHQMTVERDDEFGQLASEMNNTVRRLNDMMKLVFNTAQFISEASKKLLHTMQKTNDGVNQQYTDSELLASAMTEMEASVKEVANHALNTSEATRTATDEAFQGNKKVKDTIQTIKLLTETVQQTASVISSLESNAQRIGKVLDVIKSISEQTNLLALNAAIEAARAGESGRGFAVVADEVRTLAQKTQESTKEIQEIISTIQHGSEQAVAMIERSGQVGQTCVNNAADAEHGLQKIVEQIELINQMNIQIATSAEEQSSVTTEMSENILNVRDVSEQTAKSAQLVSENALHLDSQSRTLNIMLSRYILQ